MVFADPGTIGFEVNGTQWQLRPWALADAPVLAQAWADSEVARWNPVPGDASVAYAERWISGWHQRLRSGLALDLVIESRSALAPRSMAGEVSMVGEIGIVGEVGLVGEVGISGLEIDRGRAAIGYWLLPAGRSRGLAAGAVTALTNWVFARHGPDPIGYLDAVCHVDNVAAHRVAERAGFVSVHNDVVGEATDRVTLRRFA